MPGLSPHAWTHRSSQWKAQPSAFKTESIADPRGGYCAQSKIRHTRQSRVNRPDEAFGELVMSKGEHRFVFDIEPSTSSGSCVRVGVASTDGHYRWGIRPIDGRAVCVLPGLPSAEDRERQSRALLADKPLATTASERAVAQRVEVTVDMARRQVLYSIDGGIAVDSGVLPDDCAQPTQ